LQSSKTLLETMPEATIICCDCTEYMRNGDFNPSRFAGQSDAVSLISNAKTQQNHENTVGLIAMHPNAKADVLVNCTQDVGRVLSSLAKMRIGDNSLIKPPSMHGQHGGSGAEQKSADRTDDSINILVALQTAQLALKHRKNKKQDQRIILFVGSPIADAQNEKQLVKAAKRLKKNNVSVDIVNFGESECNTALLTKFMSHVAANDNSNLVTVEAGKLLSDVLVSTPIFGQGGAAINEFGALGGAQDADLQAAIRASQGDAGGAAQGGDAAQGGAAPFGGVDPNMDPELAMALRMSMEEERQRQEAEAKKAGDGSGDAEVPAQSGDANVASAVGGDASAKASVGGAVGDMAEALDIDEEDEELLKALQMSMAMEEDGDVAMGGNGVGNDDDGFVDDLLGGLPGMDEDDLNEIANMDELLEAVDDDKPEDKDAKKGDGKDGKK